MSSIHAPEKVRMCTCLFFPTDPRIRRTSSRFIMESLRIVIESCCRKECDPFMITTPRFFSTFHTIVLSFSPRISPFAAVRASRCGRHLEYTNLKKSARHDTAPLMCHHDFWSKQYRGRKESVCRLHVLWMDVCCLGNIEMCLNVFFRTTRSRRYHRQTVSPVWERMYYLLGQSKCSMKIFAKTGERGEPIAAPLVCS